MASDRFIHPDDRNSELYETLSRLPNNYTIVRDHNRRFGWHVAKIETEGEETPKQAVDRFLADEFELKLAELRKR